MPFQWKKLCMVTNRNKNKNRMMLTQLPSSIKKKLKIKKAEEDLLARKKKVVKFVYDILERVRNFMNKKWESN